ncbi:GNAT family N-acetyltransferase [Thalassobacillus sp. C254]|uniref:GNAT family N-acetyltransferase n=1 Tax=Thalassobacillus sp. C254 TaxID=1225341 RepID=UPI0006D01E3A|nr:GNAT family N-acetyltransferase [Thalassobacillus sp. C254]
MKEISIRTMEEKDLISVQRVACITWHDAYHFLLSKEERDEYLQRAYSEERLGNYLKEGLHFVAEQNEMVIGFAGFFRQDMINSWLVAMFVLPEYQNLGAGKALFQAGKSALIGMEALLVEVEQENKPALSFYEHIGFEKVKEDSITFPSRKEVKTHILKYSLS